MSEKAMRKEAEVLSKIISTLQGLDSEVRDRILSTAMTFFNSGAAAPNLHDHRQNKSAGKLVAGFTEDLSMSPKAFMLEKQPRTDIDRIACLAYFLAHYRDMPYFKTIDLSKVNTEAAQPKFTNAAFTSLNAVKRGYLVQATKGNRQLSAVGEQYVQALPDRDAAKQVMATMGKRKRTQKGRRKNRSLSAKRP